MTPLCELALKYDTDKCPDWHEGTGHTYTPFYHHYLFRDRTIRSVLEIGICASKVCKGPSLRMWADYWPKAEIYGIDVVPWVLVNEGRIHSCLCDQGDPRDMQKLLGYRFDLIIDDGSHRETDQISAAQCLIPCLSPGGLYVIEDVQMGTQERIRAALSWPSDLYELEVNKRSDNRLIVFRGQA